MAPISNKVDGVFRMRSLGTAASGLSDQYSDGKAAKVWQLYIGESSARTAIYKSFLVDLLKGRKCQNVFDAACGTGVDSVMLIEEGFHLVSADASDKMLKTAYKTRWERRKEELFDKWDIDEANWLNLDNINRPAGSEGFDAIICMGNSFAHLPDFFGDQRDHAIAIDNFYSLLRPGGVLIIDHRNYDYILDHGKAPKKNIYYNSKHISDIKTSILYVNNKPNMITLDYEMDVSHLCKDGGDEKELGQFRLSYYPHRMKDFSSLLKGTFGAEAKHEVYADFKPLKEEENPAFYIHVIERPAGDEANH